MSDLINLSSILNISTILASITGVVVYIRKWVKESEIQKKIYKAEFLKEAKEADRALEAKLDNKIHDLELNIEVMKEAHEKDLEHIRETYSSELKNISEKIEVLRDELRQQTAGILQLLSKMIEKND